MKHPGRASNYITGDIFTFRPSKRTLRAWEPLGDCIGILFQFQNSEIVDGGEELPEWRTSWVAGLALLRTIGHVLAKVDSKASTQHATAIEGLWKRLKTDRAESHIFWEFIERERNNLLKTARLSRNSEGYYVALGDDQDAFEMFREAVYWWRRHLMKIESEIA